MSYNQLSNNSENWEIIDHLNKVKDENILL